MEAGDNTCGSRWDKVRDPTGSPLARKASTRWRKTSRGRSVKPCGITKGVRDSKDKLLEFLLLLLCGCASGEGICRCRPTLADPYMRLHAPFQCFGHSPGQPRPRPDARRFPDPG